MKHLEPNLFRGFVGLIALVFMMARAWIMWGAGTAMFSVGLLLAIDASSDEAVERFTGISRFPQSSPTHQSGTPER